MMEGLLDFLGTTGFMEVTWKMVVMWAVVVALLYLAIAKGFEPLLLVPIAFGALIANLPTRGVITVEEHGGPTPVSAIFRFESEPVPHAAPAPTTAPDAGSASTDHEAHQVTKVLRVEGGLYDFIMQGVKLEIFPPLIFLGVGALTDFGPLIAMPRTLLLGAAAQLGLFITFMGAGLMGFTAKQAASIGIIGGADGPTAIFLTNKLAPELLGAVAVAAYSYMSLVPLIQPPIMRLLTTKRERLIRMKSLRKVSRLEKLIFAIMVMIICVLLVPDASALIAMLMLGNFLRKCAVTDRLVRAAQNEIINVLTIFLGTCVGITMRADSFLAPSTLMIIVLGVVAFAFSTAGGVLAAKLMNAISPRNPLNPLIGSAGVSAVPMAARVSHTEGQRYDRDNYLLMHAMWPNVAGVIGTAVAAGYFLSALSGP
jgi:carboxybiotin decarboxylase